MFLLLFVLASFPGQLIQQQCLAPRSPSFLFSLLAVGRVRSFLYTLSCFVITKLSRILVDLADLHTCALRAPVFFSSLTHTKQGRCVPPCLSKLSCSSLHDILYITIFFLSCGKSRFKKNPRTNKAVFFQNRVTLLLIGRFMTR